MATPLCACHTKSNFRAGTAVPALSAEPSPRSIPLPGSRQTSVSNTVPPPSVSYTPTTPFVGDKTTPPPDHDTDYDQANHVNQSQEQAPAPDSLVTPTSTTTGAEANSSPAVSANAGDVELEQAAWERMAARTTEALRVAKARIRHACDHPYATVEPIFNFVAIVLAMMYQIMSFLLSLLVRSPAFCVALAAIYLSYCYYDMLLCQSWVGRVATVGFRAQTGVDMCAFSGLSRPETTLSGLDQLLDLPPSPPIGRHTAFPVGEFVGEMHTFVRHHAQDFVRGERLQQLAGEAEEAADRVVGFALDYEISIKSTHRRAIYSLETFALRSEKAKSLFVGRSALSRATRDFFKRVTPFGLYRVFVLDERMAQDYLEFASQLQPEVHSHVTMCRTMVEELQKLHRRLDDVAILLKTEEAQRNATCEEWTEVAVETLTFGGKMKQSMLGKSKKQQAFEEGCRKRTLPPICCQPLTQWRASIQVLMVNVESIIKHVMTEKVQWKNIHAELRGTDNELKTRLPMIESRDAAGLAADIDGLLHKVRDLEEKFKEKEELQRVYWEDPSEPWRMKELPASKRYES